MNTRDFVFSRTCSSITNQTLSWGDVFFMTFWQLFFKQELFLIIIRKSGSPPCILIIYLFVHQAPGDQLLSQLLANIGNGGGRSQPKKVAQHSTEHMRWFTLEITDIFCSKPCPHHIFYFFFFLGGGAFLFIIIKRTANTV